ncbi:MAG: BACON domain-containing carbohydrate-binding protein [Bacteroidota bacterium]|nr:BACON domain-containing carbohydrate-binding protein [Bacteroidota bacterium]
MKAKLFFVVLCMTISPMVWAQINLLVNPGAENDFEGWSMRDTLYQGGYPSPSYWSVYTDEKSCHRGTKYWASSYGKSTLVQTIDLLKLGYSTRSLDDVNPDYPGYTIFAGVYFCNTGTMTIKLELCDENDHVKSTRYVCNNEIIPYRVGWTLRSAFIRDIGTGIRKIKFYLICSGELTGKGLPGPCFDDAFVCLVGNNYVAAAESALNLKPYVGSNDTIDVFSNLDWISVVIPSWLSFTPESGNGNGTINVATAEVNNTGAPRSARINIGGKNIENHTHVVITQEAGTLSVNCNEIFLSQKADSWANFYIYSNTKWTISKSCDWLRVAKESGIGDVGNALITLSENTTGTFRTATITITAEGANPQIIKVTQLGAAQIS